MLLRCSILLTGLCLSISSFAAPKKGVFKKQIALAAEEANSVSPTTNTSVTRSPLEKMPNFEPKGVRVSFFKPVLNYRVRSSTATSKDLSLSDTFGLSAGYANLPYRDIGWTANTTYIEIYEGEKIGLLRVDGNIAYGFEKNLNAKVGVNMAKFIIPDRVRDQYDPNFGFQASIGFAATKNYGLDVGYTWMKTTNSNNEIVLSGIEIGLTGTF